MASKDTNTTRLKWAPQALHLLVSCLWFPIKGCNAGKQQVF